MFTSRRMANGNRLDITGELRHLKGNKSPYFSLTATEYEKGRDVAGGMMHDEILKVAPELKPLEQLHLSDDNGEPIHSVENSLYWLRNGFYWKGGKFEPNKDQSEEKSLQFMANHLRISLEDAQTLRSEVLALPREQQKPRMEEFVATQRPRWKQEARQAIETFNLVVVHS